MEVTQPLLHAAGGPCGNAFHSLCIVLFRTLPFVNLLGVHCCIFFLRWVIYVTTFVLFCLSFSITYWWCTVAFSFSDEWYVSTLLPFSILFVVFVNLLMVHCCIFFSGEWYISMLLHLFFFVCRFRLSKVFCFVCRYRISRRDISTCPYPVKCLLYFQYAIPFFIGAHGWLKRHS